MHLGVLYGTLGTLFRTEADTGRSPAGPEVRLWRVCEYRRTFWSTQTGYAFSQSYFLDNEGNDARRSNVLYVNEQVRSGQVYYSAEV